MAYVPVPKDLTKIKTKVMFNLTKRQLVCFSGGALFGRSTFLFAENPDRDQPCRHVYGCDHAAVFPAGHVRKKWTADGKDYRKYHARCFYPAQAASLQNQ